MTVFRIIWCFFLVASSILALGPPSNNTPPVIVLERNWRIPEDEKVGTLIERVRARDAENDPLVYGLQPGLFLDGSNYFRIDPFTGYVYLNRSLKGQAKAQFYLYVTANDGNYESKMEVFVNVITPDNNTDRILPPTISPPQSAVSTATGRRPPPPPPLLHYPPTPPHPLSPGRFYPAPPVVPSPPILIPSDELEPPQRQPPVNPPRSTSGHELGVDVTATIISILAIIGLAPLIGLGIWLIQRRCFPGKDSKTFTQIKKNSRGDISIDRSSSVQISTISSCDLLTWPRDEMVDGTGSVMGVQNPFFPERNKWEFPRNQLKLLGTIGEGCFGEVWKGQAWNIANTDGVTTVAVKTLKGNAGERETKDLLSEMQVMKALEPHPNVVRFLGACTEKDPIYVIMEFVELGKLQTYLRNSRADHYYKNLHGSSKSLTSRDLTSFAYQVVRAMDFLSSKGIIHRDLAARNILVGENKVCKVADFGFARDIVSSHIYERKSDGRLPIRWMAPESLYDNVFSIKTDVWSFGILMWEIVTLGSTPYPGMAANEVMQHVRQGHRLEKPEHCKREMYNIMYYCWDKNPDERPTFAELSQTLEQLLVSDTDYIELERFPDHLYYNVVSLSSERL